MLTTELLWSKYQSAYETFSGRMVCEGVKTFAECKVNGVSIDTGKLFELRDEYKKLEENSPFDFNVNSNSELADYFIKNDVPLKSKTVSGSYSVSQIELKKIDHPLVDKYLEYKAGLSIYQKYVRPYTEMGLDTIRPDVLLWGTDTGRLSCRNPNVQQIPGRSNFKDIFRSRFKNGYIANIDLDRAELGIAALLSGDETYVEALTSQDFHKLVAAKTFEKDEKDVTYKERFIAKAVNFGGVLYGGSAKGIAARINVEPDVVASVQNWYKKEFPVLTKWIEEQKQIAVYTNAVTTFFGRKRLLDSYRRDQKERIGVNTSVQSVASDVMTFIVVQLSVLLRKHKAQSKIMFPVHDELLLDVHPDELELVVDLLRQSFKAVKKTPLGKLPLIDVLPISGELEYGDSWLYLKSDDYESKGSFYISSLE
jgi:DNA polymerase-1